MSLEAQIIDQRVGKIAEELKERLSAQVHCGKDEHKLRSAAFVFLVLRAVLDVTDEEAVEAITDGGQDFGVDAIYVGPVQDSDVAITLVQGKYSKDFDKEGEFPQSGVEGMIQAVRYLFDPGVQLPLNLRLATKVEEVRSLIADGAIPTVHVILCSNGRKWHGSVQKIIEAAAFGEQVTWQHVGPQILVRLLSATKPVNDQIALTGQAVVEDFPTFRRALIGRMSVGELAGLIERHGERLLERNIRRYLGLTGNRVNEEIERTLRDDGQRPNFYFYNNGVTIICSKFRVNKLQREDWQVSLEGLQIVNGGQTSKTVQLVVERCPEAAQAQVLVRIYELPPEDNTGLVLNITQATNSQNPVDLRDLRSNDERQKNLAEAMKDLGYTYRRQRGTQQPSGSKELTSSTVAEAVLAVWRERPHQARFNSADHFGSLYDLIFRKDLNGAQAIVAALLHRFAENKRKRPPADAPDFLPYASRFVAMMMGNHLLKVMGIELQRLDHRNFAAAESLVDKHGEAWFEQAVREISSALEPFFAKQERTLQRLSAQFRRADLVERLLGRTLTGYAVNELVSR